MQTGAPTDGELVALVYRALVRDSLLPSEPEVVGAAALRAVAADGSLPGWFTGDVERAGAWLGSRLPAGVEPFPMLAAMVLAADKPHTGLVNASFLTGVMALQTGSPRGSLGLDMWCQPDRAGLVVAYVGADGSAWRAGLRAGDLVVRIDGRPPRPSGLESLALYAAEPGTAFALEVERPEGRLDVDLVTGPGPLHSVRRRWLPGSVGMITIPWYASAPEGTPDRAGGSDTDATVRAAIEEFDSDGAAGLVFDLRSGVGGSLTAVRGILAALCDAEVVVAVAPAVGRPGEAMQATRLGDRIWFDKPVAVIVSEQTTSAAECLAIGLQELCGAEVIGSSTSGGLNTLDRLELRDGYALVLPDLVFLGPASQQPRPGYRLEPSTPVPNPTAADVLAGRDAQVDAAAAVVASRR